MASCFTAAPVHPKESGTESHNRCDDAKTDELKIKTAILRSRYSLSRVEILNVKCSRSQNNRPKFEGITILDYPKKTCPISTGLYSLIIVVGGNG
jgi:hypothetical protein